MKTGILTEKNGVGLIRQTEYGQTQYRIVATDFTTDFDSVNYPLTDLRTAKKYFLKAVKTAKKI